jgi:hypothetical protein
MSLNLGFFNEQDRRAFEMLKDPQQYPAFTGKVISQGYLRQQLTLVNGQASYTFNLTSNQANSTPLPQKLLNVTDTFFSTRMGLFLLKQVTAEAGGFELQSYPNPTYFPAVAGPSAFNPQDMEVIYNGSLSITVNNIILVNGLPTKRFRTVPQTLQSGVNSKSEMDLSDALIPIVPYPRFDGTQSIEVTVKIPTFTGMEIASATAGTTHELVLYTEGFLIAQGSAVGNGN